MGSPDAAGASTLDAIAEKAQRALRERPHFSIRARLTLSLLVWVGLSVAITVSGMVHAGRIQAKLRFFVAVDRYAFEIQQARRHERDYFLYGTNLSDALERVRSAKDILERGGRGIATVIGESSLEAMRTRVQQYEALLSRLGDFDPRVETAALRRIEAELRVEGAGIVDEATALANVERDSVDSMLQMSRRMVVFFPVVLLFLFITLAIFGVRMMLVPLHRITVATRRIAEGDLTPIVPRWKYYDEFSELATGVNYMLHELVRRQQVLVQAHKLQAVGTLTAAVAHELNNPINNLMLTAAALQEDYSVLSEAEKLEMASDLVTESERAAAIVRGLLDFARQGDAELAAIDLEQLVGDTLRLASNQVKLSRVEIQCDVGDNLPPVYGDRRQLIQVFLNLVLNALAAMPEGGKLMVSVESPMDKETVRIRFVDNGTGIPEHIRKQVFEPFFSTRKHGRGTGLGLSVSRGIMEQHGGTIEVESTVGRGSTFTVSLPVARLPARSDRESGNSDRNAGDAVARTGTASR